MATTHIPVSGAPVLVYTPASQGVPHVTLINEGTATAYIGQAGVTLASGLPLAPRQQVSLPFCPVSLYAVSGATATATATTLSAAIASGVTTIPVTSGASFVNGNQIQIGTGSAAEVVTVTAGGGTNSLTTTPATQYDHKTASAVTVVTPAGVSVHTESGF